MTTAQIIATPRTKLERIALDPSTSFSLVLAIGRELDLRALGRRRGRSA